MIVGYLNIIGIAIDEAEADAPLIVNGYGVLTLSRSMQGVKAIAGRHSEIVQCCCKMYILQTPHGSSDQIRREAF